MSCSMVWPSASPYLYVVAHCDKQLHAPGLELRRFENKSPFSTFIKKQKNVLRIPSRLSWTE